ncbi:MAG: hypothetical protein ABTR07_05845 [Candidatus Competibacter denitrificans]
MDEILEIKRRLKDKGLSLRQWSLAHGFNEHTANTTLKRWGGRKDRAPHGGISREIMNKLRKEVKQEAKA